MIKAQFVVTIDGSWLQNGKRATKADIRRELREAVKDRFEYLADRVTITELTPETKDQP